MKWPRYVILQRQRKVLSQRLKVPPTVNQFKNTLEKNQAAELFRLLGELTELRGDALYLGTPPTMSGGAMD